MTKGKKAVPKIKKGYALKFTEDPLDDFSAISFVIKQEQFVSKYDNLFCVTDW